MQLKGYLIPLILALSIVCGNAVGAFSLPQSLPLPQTVAQGEVIVVARIKQLTPNISVSKRTVPLSGPMSPDDVIDLTTTSPSAQYTFQVIRVVKGRISNTFQIDLPPIVSIYYGRANLHVVNGNVVLLFLEPDAKGRLVPVDPTVPLILLSNTDVPSSNKNPNENPLAAVISLIVNSLIWPEVRQANTFLIRRITSPVIIKYLQPYLNDPNLAVEDNVIYCSATNQVVDIIPRLIRLEAIYARKDESADCVTTLGGFQSRDAVPFLNPLLFSPDQYVRINTMFSLQSLANSSSVPYLVLALRDPDPQNVVPYGAYVALHRIISATSQFTHLKPIDDQSVFEAHRQEELLPLYNWWNDELMGVHFHAVSKQSIADEKRFPEAVSELNLLLVKPVPSLRERAIQQLEKRSNHSSIPYLVLALQYPDSNVAYGAYKTLHRLIGSLGPAVSSKAFAINPQANTQPIYQWWSDELLGKHLPPSTPEQPAAPPGKRPASPAKPGQQIPISIEPAK